VKEEKTQLRQNLLDLKRRIAELELHIGAEDIEGYKQFLQRCSFTAENVDS